MSTRLTVIVLVEGAQVCIWSALIGVADCGDVRGCSGDVKPLRLAAPTARALIGWLCFGGWVYGYYAETRGACDSMSEEVTPGREEIPWLVR